MNKSKVRRSRGRKRTANAEKRKNHANERFTSWLYLKYKISFSEYRNKPKTRRRELRQEFYSDTGQCAPQFLENVDL